ncbi:hypothetical protein [Candidatus Parabeggiatoa sp. HSG14]|uniref:hypothetical protein n=1 Tax=Candidatus Parabeggiatoa sp. HSG14 TaxID=3055593 RepID=UPI0025A9216F|nr:hypothetical protein [Thiotrichales bacterium HSG14]
MNSYITPLKIFMPFLLIMAMGNSALANEPENEPDSDKNTVANNTEKSEDILTKSPALTMALIKNLWQKLDQTTNQCPDEQNDFPEAGMRIFYCHLKTFLSYEQLQTLVRIPIFLNGPHSKTELKVDAKNSFGHYNPAFVKWLTENLMPAAKEAAFKERTQPLYNQYVKPLARTYYVIHERLVAHPDYRQKQQANYFKLLKNGQLPEYYENLHQQGFNSNAVKSGIAFWLRRFIDGTESAFFEGLKTLLMTYDADFIIATQVLEAKIYRNTQVWTYKRIINPQLPELTFKFIGRLLSNKRAEIVAMQFYQGNESRHFQTIKDVNRVIVIDGNDVDFRLKDINLDSYQDIRLMINSQNYFCWLFDSTKKLFVGLLLKCGW